MTIFSKLYKVNLISPKGLGTFTFSAVKYGINLQAMLNFASKMNPDAKIFSDDEKFISYKKLLQSSNSLSGFLNGKFGISNKKNVGLICRNNIEAVTSIFAISGLGAELFLLNPDFSEVQFQELCNKVKFDLFICDDDIFPKLQKNISENIILTTSKINNKILNVNNLQNIKLKKRKSGSIIVLTGGTSGKIKVAKRKPSIFDFINPFFALLKNINLDEHKTVFIATPIYHGFGLATLIISVLLGSNIFILPKFDTPKISNIIKKYKIEVITLVPVMLQRLLDFNVSNLKSLRKIISGGAAISPKLVTETLNSLGKVLYNLYGTSEAGFSVMASPNDLAQKKSTIGKPIQGVKLKILDKEGNKLSINQIGVINLTTKWSMYNKNSKKIPTGDLGYIDKDGHLFVVGRADDMIVSGGENVYPITVENILLQHPKISEVIVIGIDDTEFGQRLKAFVILKKDANLSEKKLFAWLKDKVARFQMPAKICFIDNFPLTSVGKIDKKKLKNL